MKKSYSSFFALFALMATSALTPCPLNAQTSPGQDPNDYPTIYGSVVYANSFVGSGNEVGLYEIPTSDSPFQQIFPGPAANSGGCCREGVYYAVNYTTSSGIVATITGYDLLSGREVYSVSTDHTIMGHLAVDPLSNDIYGITFRPELGGYMLSKIELYPSEVKVTRIANLDGFWAAFAIDDSGQFYGISKTNAATAASEVANLYKISRTSGATTLVGKTGGHPIDQTDATIDLATNRMFWATSSPEEGGQLLEVNLQTAETRVIAQFEDGQQVTGLFIPEAGVSQDVPAECRNVKLVFDTPDKKGTLTLQAPSTLYDGETPGSGELYVIAFTGNDEVGYQDVEWGQDVTIPIDMSRYEEGFYNFMVQAVGRGGEGPKTYLNKIFVGRDAPAATIATLDYADGRMNLSWLPVYDSANGGYIDVSDISYTVKRNDGSVAASGLKTTNWSEAMAEPSTVKEVFYTVTAVSGGISSAPAASNAIILGAYSLPYTSNYASNPDLTYFTVIDANDDGTTWTRNNGNVACAYNQYEKMNDWLITPPFKLQANHPYILRFPAFAEMSSSPERLEVKFGTSNTPEGMTGTALEPTLISNVSNNPKEFECYIVPQTTGNYFIGFHGISDAYMYRLYLGDFTIEASAISDNPGAPANLTVTPDPASALRASISFNAPSVTVAQEPLTSLTKAELYRGGTLIKTFSNPAPGALLTFDDTVEANGMYEYSAVAYNDEGKGMEASASAFIGQDIPAAPQNVVIRHAGNPTDATVEWTPVTTDRHGKPVYGQVTYTIRQVLADGTRIPVVNGITSTSYTFEATDYGVENQVFVQCEVNAMTSAGRSENSMSDILAVGEAYTSFRESFSDGIPSLNWGESRDFELTHWELYNNDSGLEAQDNDNGFAAFYGVDRGETATLYSGNISLANVANPALAFYLYNNSTPTFPNRNSLEVLARGYSELEWSPLFDKTITDATNAREGWQKVVVDLSAYAGSELQIAFKGETANYRYFFLDNIQVVSLPARDLAAARLTAPFSVKAGTDYSVKLKVDNLGATDASNYQLVLYADGNAVETRTGAAIPAHTSCDFDFTLHMPDNATDAINYSAKIVFDQDADMSNNQTTGTTVMPFYTDLPGATNLIAGSSAPFSAVELNWDEARFDIAPGEAVTQSFEDGDAFQPSYGNWIFVDRDNSPVSGPADYEIPNVEYGSTTGSFWIWDAQQLPSDHFTAHSGNKFLFSLFRRDGGAADDWAISPELSGDAQTISFWAKSAESMYLEKIEVYYSTGSTSPADFVKLPGVGGNVPARWTEFSAKLPAGARRFTIRSCAADALMLQVDDVTFVPAEPYDGASFVGYDIYRNNVKINASPTSATSYVDSDISTGTRYTYNVVAVYDLGLSRPSNSASITGGESSIADIATAGIKVSASDGCILIGNAAGLDVAVAAANGMMVYAGNPADDNFRLRTGNGVYIVRVANNIVKIIVK